MDLKCAICVDVFKEPRKLPGCSHSFCGECLLTYILNLKREDSLGLEFPCPVCKQPTPLPDDNEVTVEWIQNLGMDSELESKVKQEKLNGMDENSCHRCKYLGKQSKSIVYCLTCREYLCSSCSDILHARADCATHSVINTTAGGKDKYDGLHDSALKLMDQFFTCTVHLGSSLQFQCELHGDMVCSLCAVKKHRNCESLTELKDLSAKKNLQAQKEDLVRCSENSLEHIGSIIDVYKENETESKQDKEKIQTEFQEMKGKVIQLLDNLEASVLHESGAAAKKINIDQVDELKASVGKYKICRYLIQNCLANAPDKCVYICIENVRKICHDIEQKLVQQGNIITKKNLALRPETLLNGLLNLGLNETSALANIEVKEKKVTVPYKGVQLQKSYKVDKIRSIFMRSENYKGRSPTYNNLLHLGNETMLLVDSCNGYCCLFRNQGEEIVSKKFVQKSETQNKPALNYMDFLQYATLLESNLIALSLTANSVLYLQMT